MEQIHCIFDGGHLLPGAPRACLVGVVASGNLEVLIEPAPLDPRCIVDVSTAEPGFGATWEAVLRAFFERHRLGGVHLSINDAGATPAIVSLRLDQAVAEFTGGPREP